ncbi:7-carboxy-7-deazaguanine synthase QueE [Nitratifractor salsuginis]|uniref:7-carboxy-7-deazaguanine synthase n=1 Tax=Nitratifractor salsuginis (strain DSM 16511 / JCM 12458 / E9I37-1) TaxID=749222 RepID=E6X235_NITSE|nr:7-carboxy-7-deazaguanine synthase QueE [Nitratifractor salsuginis]ADV47104.1 Radical SAM domain protein [Nitratifractor salsuginis DSM 16511]
MFWLTEKFLSIQGEGRYAGVPSYFLRTGGCNLHCPGFGAEYDVEGEKRYGCDTWFSVDRAFAARWQAVESAAPLLEEMDRAFLEIGYLPHVVITGGEPLIYAADPAFYEVVEGLVERGVQITFETNGTVAPDFLRYGAYKACTFALSVKLSNSGEPKERRIHPEVLRTIASEAGEAFLKFTLDRSSIESGEALREIEEIRNYLPETEVYCMPMGESREVLRQNDWAVFAFCIRHNFHYSDRLHIRIFDTTVGV